MLFVWKDGATHQKGYAHTISNPFRNGYDLVVPTIHIELEIASSIAGRNAIENKSQGNEW